VNLGAIYPAISTRCRTSRCLPAAGRVVRQRSGANDNFGVKLGQVAVRGERGALIVGAESLMRASSNPFYDYEIEKLMATLPLSGVPPA
jgi:hypothetical protein